MKAVTKKIVLLVSISSVIIGCMLVVFYLDVLPKDLGEFVDTLTKLWPVTLIIAGIIFLRDSLARRHYLRLHQPEEKSLFIPYHDNPRTVSIDVSFSFGNLAVSAGQDEPSTLSYEQFGPMPDPIIENQNIGKTAIIKITKAKPYLSPHFRIHNRWALFLTNRIPHTINLALHEADLSVDLRDLDIEHISLRADSGTHSVYFPKTKRRFSGSFYSSSEKLSLMVPDESFVQLNLLNPFCRIDFPQGDFERKNEGTILSANAKKDFGIIELDVDGPLKQLVIDII